MTQPIQGVHHVTSLASSARGVDSFFTRILGLRRVKKTVNFDAPDVYHLYYGNGLGTPGTVITHFPFEGAKRGRPGTGEVSVTAFSVPLGSLAGWRDRFLGAAVQNLREDVHFGQNRLLFPGPDGEVLALVESADSRAPWTGGGVDADMAIRGFHSVMLRLADTAPTAQILAFLGYTETQREGETLRMTLPDNNGAGIVDLEISALPMAVQGAGSVHHVAFAVADRATQDTLRANLTKAGMGVTPAIDRDYFTRSIFAPQAASCSRLRPTRRDSPVTRIPITWARH